MCFGFEEIFLKHRGPAKSLVYNIYLFKVNRDICCDVFPVCVIEGMGIVSRTFHCGGSRVKLGDTQKRRCRVAVLRRWEIWVRVAHGAAVRHKVRVHECGIHKHEVYEYACKNYGKYAWRNLFHAAKVSIFMLL